MYMKMRAGLQSQCSHLTWQDSGGGAGIVEQRLALSVQLCDPGRPGRETPEPRSLTEDSPHQHSHNAALAQTHK